MARPTKPAARKRAEGNPGKRAIPENRPRPDAGEMPTAPTWLDKEARAEWKRVTAVISKFPGWLGRIDRALLADTCATWADIVALRKILKGDGYIITTAQGNKIQHPAAGALHTKEKIHIRQLSEMGLTPTSREKVGLSEKKDDLDEFTTYVSQKGKALGR